MKTVLGLDIAKQKFDAALILNGKIKHKVFANNSKGFIALNTWIATKGIKNIHACMESTGSYGLALANYLYNNKYRVSIVNPFKIKAYGQSKLLRNKTDKADAGMIAGFCAQSDDLSAWEPKPEHIEKLNALTKRLDDLIDMQRQEKNRLEFADKSIRNLINASIKLFDKQTNFVKKEIENLINQHSDIKKKQELLETIPGVGNATIFKVLAILDKPENFSNAKKVAAYIGLSPRNFESGSSVHGKTRLTKIGNVQLRKALYFPAIVAMRYNPILKTFCERLARKGKCKMSIIGAAMRKLVHIIYGVLKTGKPFDVNFCRV